MLLENRFFKLIFVLGVLVFSRSVPFAHISKFKNRSALLYETTLHYSLVGLVLSDFARVFVEDFFTGW